MRCLVSLSLTLTLGALAPALAVDFAHVQLERSSARLGETLWYRVHGELDGATVQLVSPSGQALETRALPRKAEGGFFLDPARPGGRWHVEVRRAGALLHRAPCEVYDLRSRQLDLSLKVLGEFVYPGETLRAAVFARELDGTPIADARLSYRAQLGGVVLEGRTSPTDADGGVVLDLEIPAHALDSGSLSLALEHGGSREAVSRPVIVSGSVADVAAFVEGGAVVPGRPHRVGLLVRDRDGVPTPAEGRLVDDQGRCVDVVRADRFGQAVVVAPYETERSYHVRIDRPAGVTQRFPLPGASGHAHGLRLEPADGGLLRAWVWGAEDELELLRLRDGEVVQRTPVRLAADDQLLSVDFPPTLDFGVEEIVLVRGERAVARAATVRGNRWPVQVEVRPLVQGAGCRGEVALEVRTLDRRGEPVRADLALSVFRAGSGISSPQLPMRDLLAPFLVGEAAPHALDDLFREGAEERREAFLLTRAAWAYPPDGVALVDGAAPSRDVARRGARSMQPRPRATPEEQTRVRGKGELAELLARAPYTRAPQEQAGRSFGRADAPRIPQAPRRAAKRPPQRTKVPAKVADTRDGLCWAGQVQTNRKGRAVVRFRLGDDTARLSVRVEGYAGELPLGGSSEVRAHEQFSARLEFPGHLRVGDRVDAWVELAVHDGGTEPLAIALDVPPCLRALDRAAIRYRPGKDDPRAKFRFEVVAPSDGATLTVGARRGVFVDRVRHAFSVGVREVELSFGRSATAQTSQRVSFTVPEGAVPGSVRVEASVAPFSLPPSPSAPREDPPPTPGMALDDLESMLRQPTGCFSQTTSSNWPNLAVLSTLLETGVDAHALERAYSFAEQGYRRILTFQRGNGGFALYPGQDASVRYTIMAVPQLAAFARLFRGRGSNALQRALRYLDGKTLDPWTQLRLVSALHEAGRGSARADAVLGLKPKTSYERALFVNCLAAWPEGDGVASVGSTQATRLLEDVPASAPAAVKARRARLAEELEALCRSQASGGLFPSSGVGLMGSRGPQLELETTALAVPALIAGGRRAEASLAVTGLAAARQGRRGWGTTRTTCLVVRALAHVVDLDVSESAVAVDRELRAATDPVAVSFSCNGQRQTGFVGGRRDRPQGFTGRPAVGPGQRLDLALSASSERTMIFGFNCAYRVARPVSSPRAPYRLRVRLPGPQTQLGELSVGLSVAIERTGAPLADGQVVAKIAIPGGLKLGELEPGSFGCGRYDVEQGSLVIYWERPDDVPRGFSVPLIPVVAGSYEAMPSVIYPYYEPQREAYAAPLKVRIDAAYDVAAGMLKLEAAAGAGR